MSAAADSPSSESSSSQPQIRIRRATEDDVPALVPLINAAFVVEQVVFEGDRVDDLALRVYMSSGIFLVAEDAGRLVGCVYIETKNDRSYLGLLSVQPSRQGGGLGRQLVIAAEELARQSGSRIMDLRVISARGEQLLPFYERLGYAFVCTEPFPPDLKTKNSGHYILMSKAFV
jgi:N-acetylglutamate synthase-like GNAT family acetyltransferase